jgi:2-iminobutanoate/2-iminopropanoate deaminase
MSRRNEFRRLFFRPFRKIYATLLGILSFGRTYSVNLVKNVVDISNVYTEIRFRGDIIMKRTAFTAAGAVSVGPYSHAVEADGFVYLSGQTPLDTKTGKLVEGDIRDQTRQSFVNLFNVLAAAGLTPDDIVKATVYLTDMKNFAGMNEVYATQFVEPYPARTTIGVVELPLGALVEIELIAKR